MPLIKPAHLALFSHSRLTSLRPPSSLGFSTIPTHGATPSGAPRETPHQPLVDCVFKAILGSEQQARADPAFSTASSNRFAPLFGGNSQPPTTRRSLLATSSQSSISKPKMSSTACIRSKSSSRCSPPACADAAYLEDIYRRNWAGGDNYNALNPVISVWMLVGKLFPETPVAHHCFQIADVIQQKVLIDHCAMHILELEKWRAENAPPLKTSGCCFSAKPGTGRNCPST